VHQRTRNRTQGHRHGASPVTVGFWRAPRHASMSLEMSFIVTNRHDAVDSMHCWFVALVFPAITVLDLDPLAADHA
jgi:hypothetical protein